MLTHVHRLHSGLTGACSANLAAAELRHSVCADGLLAQVGKLDEGPSLGLSGKLGKAGQAGLWCCGCLDDIRAPKVLTESKVIMYAPAVHALLPALNHDATNSADSAALCRKSWTSRIPRPVRPSAVLPSLDGQLLDEECHRLAAAEGSTKHQRYVPSQGYDGAIDHMPYHSSQLMMHRMEPLECCGNPSWSDLV